MSKRRPNLRSRVSSSLLNDDAELYNEPETPVKAVQSPAATSRSTRLTRSTFRKVEDTPSQSSRCSNGAPATSPATEIQKTPRRQLHQTFTDIPLSEDSQVTLEAGKTPSRGSQSVTGSLKRDHAGHWVSKSHPGKLNREPGSNAGSTQEEDSAVRQTKSERRKELLKPTLRKSMRIAKQLNLDSPQSPVDIERNASQPEENVDTNGGQHVTEQSEVQTPKVDTKVGEEFEAGKLDQDDVEMEKEEDKEGQSLCDISASFVLEPESLSVKISRMSTGSDRNSRKLKRKSVGNAESASVENSPGQQTTELESTKELLKPASRKPLCIVKQLKLDSPQSPISFKDVCPEHNTSQQEKSVDTNGGPHVMEQSETQTPKLDTGVEEELEVGKLDQDDVGMEKEEDKEEQSLCDISTSCELEPKSLSGEDLDQNSKHSGSDSAQTEDVLGTEVSPQANIADQQVQKVIPVIVASDSEDSKSEESEREDELVVEDLSPKKSQENAFGGSPPFKQANGTLGDGTELVSEVPVGIACGEQSLACEAMSVRQEAEGLDAARCPEEESPCGVGSHEGASCPGSPPSGSGRGETHRGLAKGDGGLALRAGREEISGSLSEARGNGECVVECLQCPGGAGTVLRDVATAASPDNARPRADTRQRENAWPIKQVNENGLTGRDSPASEVKAGKTDSLPGSPAWEMEATSPPALPIPDPNSGASGPPTSELEPRGTDLPGSTVLETGATGTDLSESAVSERGGTGFPGTFISEALGEGADPPGVTVSKIDGRETLLVSEPESGEANGRKPATLERERPPPLNSKRGQKVTNSDDRCASLQESEPGIVATSVSRGLENEGASQSLTSAQCAVHEMEVVGKDLESLEEVPMGTGATEGLNTREDSVSLPPAESKEGQTSTPASELRDTSPEAEGDSGMIGDPSLPPGGRPDISAGDPPRAGKQSGNTMSESECTPPGVPAAVLTGEWATPAGMGDGSVTPSADQEGPGDSETHRRSRRRGRGRKPCSSVEADCESRGADVLSSNQGLWAAGMTIPVSPVGVGQTSHNGVKEPWSDVQIDDSYSESEKMIVGCNHTAKAVQLEEDVEEDMDAVDEETCEVMGKQETDKATTREADEEVGGGSDQAEEVATAPKQKVGKQNMKEREKKSKPAYHLVVSNLDTARDFAELQIAIISFFMVRSLFVTSIRMKKSRKRGYITFLSRKDVNRALKYNGQQLLGRALQLRRPQEISKSMAALSTKKSKKEPVSLLRKKKKQQQAQEAALNEKVEEEESAEPSLQQPKKRKWEKMASEKSEEGKQEDKLPLTKEEIAETLTSSVSPSQKKKRKKKKQQWKMGGLTEQMVEEWSQVEKEQQPKNEEPVLSQQGAEEEEQAAYPRKKKKRALEKRKVLLMENLPDQLGKKYLKSVFSNAEGIRMCQDSQLQKVAYVQYRTVSEADEALKEFREKGFPGQVTPVGSMTEQKVKSESESDSPGTTPSLFLWGMSSNTTVDTLKLAFKGALDARISDFASKRFAVVDFRTAEEAVRAKVTVQRQKVDGQKLNIYLTNCTLGKQESVRSTHET